MASRDQTSIVHRLLAGGQTIIGNYYVNRVLQMLVTLFTVITISFVIIRFLPGGPMQALKTQLLQRSRQTGEALDEERVNNLVEAYVSVNPDQPILEQYVDYIASIATGDLGQSFVYQEPVTQIMANALPWTLLLFGFATILTFVVNIALGALMAYSERSKFDSAISLYSIVSASVPYYILAVVLILIFGDILELFPTSGKMNTTIPAGFNVPFIASILNHMALPMLSIVLTSGATSLAMRANSISVLGENYVRVARLRGLTSYTVATRYVGRNAILPMYTSMMIRLGTLFGGSVVLETVFSYSGLGYVLFSAIESRDYSLMMGGFILITAMIVLGLFIADLTYGFLDPRIRASDSESFGTALSFQGFVSRIWSLTPFGSGAATPDERERVARTTDSDTESVLNFDTGSEYDSELSTKEKLAKVFDTYVYAPFMVLWSDWRGKTGLSIVGVYVFAGTFGVVLLDIPRAHEFPRLVPPLQNLAYPLGTGQMGMSLLEQMIHATPAMLQMITSGALFATSVAVFLGILAGYRGGVVDRVLMTVADVAMSIPGLPLIMVLAVVFSPENPWLVGILLTINAWGGTARTIRSEVLSVRESAYIESGRTMGTPTLKILLQDVLPNVLPYSLIMFVQKARVVIFGSVALYFLGVLPFSKPNWGVVLNQAFYQGSMASLSAIHWVLIPILTIVVFSSGLVLISQAADALTNPRVRARHAKTIDDEEAGGAPAPR